MKSLVFSFRSDRTEHQPCPRWTSHDVDTATAQILRVTGGINAGVLQVPMPSRLEVSTTTNSVAQIC